MPGTAGRACRVLALGAILAACGSSDPRSPAPFLDWASLRNPILSAPDRALKDVAVAHDPSTGWFYVYASVRFEPSDPEAAAKTPWFYRTRDFRTYETFADPDLVGPGSPDLSLLGGLWRIVFQRPTGLEPNARSLWVSESTDLEAWGPPRELAPQVLDPLQRNIDGALARHDGFFYLVFKSMQLPMITRSVERALDGRWLPVREADAGGGFAENFQLISIDGEWRLLATGRDPRAPRCENPVYAIYTCDHEPFLYRRAGEGSDLAAWTTWVDKTHLDVPFEDWNHVMHANSAYLVDWREHDGHFYLFYAGSNDGDRFELRGHGKIGVARSRDLREWRVPPD